MSQDIKALLGARFPSLSTTHDEAAADSNPAIQAYGRRFYKDQTQVEYLAEFLLVFISPKGPEYQKNHAFSFQLDEGEDNEHCYWPEDRVSLKLFSFFPSSKLETRHPVHQETYLAALESIKARIDGSSAEQENTIRLLQSLFSGFVGVAKNRTWVTHSFLPVSTKLISRELAWKHTEATKDKNLDDWSKSRKYFSHNGHLFMARGGELLFLQLANLFSNKDESAVRVADLHASKDYQHLSGKSLDELQQNLECGLKHLICNSVSKVDALAEFVERSLEDIWTDSSTKRAPLGWVPRSTVSEAYLFAVELDNICRSSLGGIDKIDLLQVLCSLHVLRSLCFQANRIDDEPKKTNGFIGNYAWIVADPNASFGSASRKLAQTSLTGVEEVLYRVLRIVGDTTEFNSTKYTYRQADAHGFSIFRKIGKEMGFIIPKMGQGQRFVLPPSLLSVLVATTIEPGERVRLTEFYRRVFAHYGIALAGQQLAEAIAWYSEEGEHKDYAITAESLWVQEALKQGGYLVELSDAVSIVHNPSRKEQKQ